MAFYTIRIEKRAYKALQSIPKKERLRLRDTIDSLQEDPRPHGVRKLVGSDRDYRIRVGNYRIIYQIHDNELLVLVINIGDRKDVYR